MIIKNKDKTIQVECTHANQWCRESTFRYFTGTELLAILECRINLAIKIISKILEDKRLLEDERDKTFYLLHVKNKNAKLGTFKILHKYENIRVI